MASLNVQIEQVRGVHAKLESELRGVEAELETFAADRLRFDALRDACSALARLDELEAGQLFWGELAEIKGIPAHLERLRQCVAEFDGEMRGLLEKQAHLKSQVDQLDEELEYLHDDIRNAYARDERRKDEFVIEREISPVPHHPLIMPWSHDSEGERRFRRSVLIALLLSFFLTGIIKIVKLPAPQRPVVAQVPERLAKLVRKEPIKPEPVKKPKEEKKDERKEEKKPEEKVKETPKDEIKATPAERVAARTKAESSGVMAFKNTFKDLMDETPVAKLGVEARLSNSPQAAGAAQASRSLVAMQSGSGPSSGGISNAAISRNIGVGNGGGGGKGIGRQGGFARVQSSIAGLPGKEAKSLTPGAGRSRSDEEIQILFDRYKAALYRLYNAELRKDPTLRGKMVLRITIEPNGAVSACAVESSNMNAPDFSAQIVERVKKFNFGAKDGVPRTTILYPIDFLPAR
nr:AgmX/PglI C-terminal domain-containing protein [Geotalea sp. SG265]